MVKCKITKIDLTQEIDMPKELLEAPAMGQEFKGRYCNWLALVVGWTRRAVDPSAKDYLTSDQVQILIRALTDTLEGAWPDKYQVYPNLTNEQIWNAPAYFCQRMKAVPAPKPRVKKEPVEAAAEASKDGKSSDPAKKKKAASAHVPYSQVVPYLHNMVAFVGANKEAKSVVPQVDTYKMDEFFTWVFGQLASDDAHRAAGLHISSLGEGVYAIKRARDNRANAYLTEKAEGDVVVKGDCLVFHTGETARNTFRPRAAVGSNWSHILSSSDEQNSPMFGYTTAVGSLCESSGIKLPVSPAEAKAKALARLDVPIKKKAAPKKKAAAATATPVAMVE